MDRISSRQNPRVKYLKGLHTRKKRKETGEIILEGPNLIEEARRANFPFIEVLVTEDFLAKEGIFNSERLTIVTEEVMEKIAPSRSPRGIVARIKKPFFSWEEIIKEERVLILEGLQDPGNVGTLIRTAAGAGFGGVILFGEGADPFQPKALRATAGAIFKIKVAEVGNRDKEGFLSELRKDFVVFRADPGTGKNYKKVDFPEKCALILGHETKGISKEMDDQSFIPVSIPLSRDVESLNVSAAGAILLFAIKHGKSTDLPTP